MSNRLAVVVLAARRTAIARYRGALAGVPVVEFGRQLAWRTIALAGLTPADIDQTLIGCVLQAGLGQNVARQIAVRAGVPVERPAFTVNAVCASGLKAVELGAQQIRLGEAQAVLAGGVESMSNAPYLAAAPLSKGPPPPGATLLDSAQRDALLDSFEDIPMGCTAERIATRYAIGRAEQDAFALESQRRYQAARARLAEEIVPIVVDGPAGARVFDVDEHPRETSASALAGLSPSFSPDGAVTAGNASGVNDGAALAVIAARPWAEARGLAFEFVLHGFSTVGLDPGVMGLGPIGAIRALWRRFDLTNADIDLYEINEAFAGQVLAVLRELDISMAKVNVNGGAVALGHPVGASGCRILVTLLHEMRRRRARRGIASLCVGGGMGAAVLVEAA
ncbi:MAG: thiolase family protein [Actinobacteria bacterium]|nr:thiolase family protein [Actinomycetota bacterium]